MRHHRHQILLVVLFLLWGCNPPPGYSEKNPDRAMRDTWDFLCVKAELILNQNPRPAIPYSPALFFDISDYYRTYDMTSRATYAFARIYMYAPKEVIDYRFFQEYAIVAGGFEWDCPALQCLLPSKKGDKQTKKNTEALPL